MEQTRDLMFRWIATEIDNSIAVWCQCGTKCVTVVSKSRSGFLYQNPLVKVCVDFGDSYTLLSMSPPVPREG